MRNQNTGGNKKAGPSSVDKAGGKKGMPKPERTPKQTPPPTPKAQAPRKAAPSAPKAQAPRAASKPGAVGTPRGSATTGPVQATSRPLPKGVQTKRPAGRGPVAGRGPTPTPSASTPEYNPFAGRGQVPTPSADIASNRTYTPAQKAAMNNDKRYSKQGTVYMDMLNQMRSQSSSAQGMGPLSSTSL